jgi:hypothetical protein
MAVNWNAPVGQMSEPVRAKLEAFERLRSEFEACFTYVQDVHGERRLSPFPLDGVIRYLHALWVCECKDRLLSVPKTIERYEGPRALEVLQKWQQGDAASVVAFLHRKLDSLPFADLTLQIQEALASGQNILAERLTHGRMVLLNRAMNLNAALDSIFLLSAETMTAQVRAAAAQQGHTPEQIADQLATLDTALYAYVPHPMLARQSMQVMNAVGIRITDTLADRPGNRTSRVEQSQMPLAGYAQEVIEGERVLSGMEDNNPARLDEAMPPLAVDASDAMEPPNKLVGPEWTGK